MIGLFAGNATAAAWGQGSLDATADLKTTLSGLQAAKQKVVVVLRNGQTYTAAIGGVGDKFVVLTGPAQKEFYDVMVRLDDISAIEARVRGN